MGVDIGKDGTNLDELLGRNRVLPPPANSRYEKWKRWLKVADDEVTAMFQRRDTWRGVVAIVRANPAIPTSHFFDFLAHGYVTMQATAIRRQAEINPRVVSLASLLSEVLKQPTLVSRDRFVSQYPWGMQYLGDRAFNDFAGEGGSHIDAVFLQSDLQVLQRAAQSVKAYVDRHVAHTDRKRHAKDLPSYSKIDETLEVFGVLLKRYLLLFEQADRDPIAPIPQYDWMAPFRLAWIAPGRAET